MNVKRMFSLIMSFVTVLSVFIAVPTGSVAVDFSDVYTDELTFMSDEMAQSFIGFIYNVAPDKVTNEMKNMDDIFRYLTGRLTKGTDEYIYAQSAFLLTAKTFVNNHMAGSGSIATISADNLINMLQSKIGDNPDVGADVANEALGNIKSKIKKILYYAFEFDSDEVVTNIDLAMSGYQTVLDVKGKVENFVFAVEAAINSCFYITSSNTAKAYGYYVTYVNNRGHDYLELMMGTYELLSASDLDGISIFMQSVGFGNSWTNEEVQRLLRIFGEFTYHSMLEVKAYGGSGGSSGPGSTEIAVNSVYFLHSSYDLELDCQVKIPAYTSPSNATAGTGLTYSSSDTSIITVDKQSGWITPVSTGTAYVIATSGNGVQGKCKINVIPAPIRKVSMDDFDIAFGYSIVVMPGYSPAIAENKGFTFSSSDTSIFTVDSSTGKVTPVKPGVAYLKATSRNGVEGSCKVTVLPYEVYIETYMEDDAYVVIQKYVGNETDVVIPDTIMDEKVKYISGSAFEDCDGIESVRIPEGVLGIGSHAFSSCTNLKTVNIPKGVTELDSTFYGCESLVEIAIPEGVKTLGRTFEGCSNLSEVSIPKSATSLIGTFYNCTSLESIYIPDSVTYMSQAFRGCTNLKTVNIPKGVTELDSTFYGCESLTKVAIPEGVKSLNYAFKGCSSLTEITISESVTSLKAAFYDCTRLESIYIPDSVTYMSEAFRGCTNLKTVNIPKGITELDWTFFGCESLTQITIPEGVERLSYTFEKCSNLAKITIPESVTSLNSAFAYCTSLTSVEVPDGVTSILGTFGGCTNLNSVTLPDSIVDMGASFFDCTSLEEIDLPNNVQYLDSAFNGCLNLRHVEVPETVTTMKGAFSNCTSLTSATVKSWESSLDCTSAFYNCASLISVVFECDYIRPEMDEYTFYGCPKTLQVFCECRRPIVRRYFISNCAAYGVECVLMHNYGEYTSNNDSTCTEYGTMTAVCEKCAGEDIVIDYESTLKEHDFAWTVITAPTTEHIGSKEGVCKNCSETVYEEIPAVESGDTNGDNVVNIIDMTLSAQYIAQGGISGKFDLSECFFDAMDLNNDGIIDQLDLNAVAAIIRANA